MITKEELKDYARLRDLNLGQAEKDYFQNIVLFILFRHYGKTLIFKGGTALSKCYGSPRFSEDLGFNSEENFSSKVIERGLKRFKIEFEIEEKRYKTGSKTVSKIKGPLYNGTSRSVCRFIVDASFREKVILSPKIKTIGRFLEEIPEFWVCVMQEKEILSEKIRTILTRNRARDVYDLWFLLKNGVEFDLELVKEKLRYYNKKWNKLKFNTKLKEKEKIWETELRPLVGEIPKFKEVLQYIHSKIG